MRWLLIVLLVRAISCSPVLGDSSQDGESQFLENSDYVGAEWLEDGVRRVFNFGLDREDGCLAYCNDGPMDGSDCFGNYTGRCEADAHHTTSAQLTQCLGHWNEEDVVEPDTAAAVYASSRFCNGAFTSKYTEWEGKKAKKGKLVANDEYTCAFVYSHAVTVNASRVSILFQCHEAESVVLESYGKKSSSFAGVINTQATRKDFLDLATATSVNQYLEDDLQPESDGQGFGKHHKDHKADISVECNNKKTKMENPCDGLLRVTIKYKDGRSVVSDCHGVWMAVEAEQRRFSCSGSWTSTTVQSSKKTMDKRVTYCKGEKMLSSHRHSCHLSSDHHHDCKVEERCFGEAGIREEGSWTSQKDPGFVEDVVEDTVYVS